MEKEEYIKAITEGLNRENPYAIVAAIGALAWEVKRIADVAEYFRDNHQKEVAYRRRSVKE